MTFDFKVLKVLLWLSFLLVLVLLVFFSYQQGLWDGMVRFCPMGDVFFNGQLGVYQCGNSTLAQGVLFIG